MSFDQPIYVAFLLLVILVIIRFTYLKKWKKEAQKQFADENLTSKIFQYSNIKSFIINNLLLIGVVLFLTIALMDFLVGKEEVKLQQSGADVVFVLDLSNSMNADDIQPTRLDKAKNIISKTLRSMAGDRVALVVFADAAYTVLPLTQDYESLENYLSTLDTQLLKKQGTQLGAAIDEALLSLQENNINSKCIVLLSDGEDHEQKVDEAISKAEEQNVKIISVGIGSSKGTVLKEVTDFSNNGLLLDENGEPVISKLQEKELKNLADETDGVYIYANQTSETSQKITENINQLQKNSNGEITSYNSKHYFQFFIGIALILLIILSLTNLKTDFNI